MKLDAIRLEEARLRGLEGAEDWPLMHERHRVFPAIFESREHRRILDISSGVGFVAKRIQEEYAVRNGQFEVICNDLSPTCLRILKQRGLQAVSFDLDNAQETYPFSDGSFDAIISLATIEHLTNVDHFLAELFRLLGDGGRLYISAPNYSGLPYLLPFFWTGKAFHDPLGESSRYEFYAHVRYFRYRTLRELSTSFGFHLDSVYLCMPAESTHYKALYSKSKLKAMCVRTMMKFLYRLGSPRWASEPILCFSKSSKGGHGNKPRKVLL